MPRFNRTTAFAIALSLILLCSLHATQESEEAPVLVPDPEPEAPWAGDADPPPAPTAQIVRDSAIAPAGRQPQGALSGRIVYMGAGHGWTADRDTDTNTMRWFTQRGDHDGVVEDLGNVDQMTMYAFYCFNAGATVVPMRPVGHQSNEVVLDNDDPGVTFEPEEAWQSSSSSVFYGNPGDVAYRFASKSATDTAYARYTPTITEAGFYPIYTWVRPGTNRVDDQLYRILHTGGETEVRINHRMVGQGWIYIGSYYLEVGTDAYVEISNQSDDIEPGHSTIIADAIRFGNGMGDVDRGAGVSGQPREDEASRYWIQRSVGQGAGTDIFDSSSSDEKDNVSAPPRMAVNMNQETIGQMSDRIYLGFHSNASAGSIGLLNGNFDPDTATLNQYRWAELVGRECNDDMLAIGSPPMEYPWFDKGNNVVYDRVGLEYGEINNLRIDDEFDATIIEVAGHGDFEDAHNLRNPNVRNWLARACMQATIRYFNEFGSAPLVFPPDPPTNPRVESDGIGNVVVRWDAPVVDGIGGHAATGYTVYRSANGYGFGQPIAVDGGATTSLTLSNLGANEILHLRVAATNAGGESLPSETVSVRLGLGGRSPILIVNGFDRFERALNPEQTAALGTGSTLYTFERVKPRQSNSFDYPVRVAHAIETTDPDTARMFDSCMNEAIINGDVNLTDYHTVIWILGRESSADETFDSTEQAKVTAFLAGGGHLFLSGTEIGWDLDRASGPTAADRAFLNNQLHVEFGANTNDDAKTFDVAATGSSIFSGIGNFAFDDGSHGDYRGNSPDRLTPVGTGAQAAMTYIGGEGGIAAVVYDGSAGGGQVVLLGFPFEIILGADTRGQILGRVLTFFGTPGASIGPTGAGVLDHLLTGTDYSAFFDVNKDTHNDAADLVEVLE